MNYESKLLKFFATKCTKKHENSIIKEECNAIQATLFEVYREMDIGF